MSRWHAAISYRTASEPLLVEHDIEELEELQGIVERGPDWNTIITIVVTLSDPAVVGMTLEQDETLGSINPVTELRTAARALVDAVHVDDHGTAIGGQFMGGNGGLLSNETLKVADKLDGLLRATA